MKSNPGRINIDFKQIEALIERVEGNRLEKDDYPIVADLIRSMTWIFLKLEEQQLTIRRLRKIFGCGAKTERTSNINKANVSVPESTSDKQVLKEETTNNGSKEKRRSNRSSANDFKTAIILKVSHQLLKVGDRCPDCNKGNCRLIEPGKVLRIVGQPWLQAYIYEQERLRCNTCGKVFTAQLPVEVMRSSKYDKTANAIVCLLKYRGGFPFYRQESLQRMLETPISDNVMWEMTNDVAKCLAPIHDVLIREAAKGDCIHNDDTKARILELIQENKRLNPDKERTGIFTSAILSRLDNKQIALFFTGRQHAGENLNDVLNVRPKEKHIPIQVCDASSSNKPKDHPTNEANCLAHLRRKFYEIAEIWPSFILPIIALINKLFRNNREVEERRLNDVDRLKWHHNHSAPVMRDLKKYCDELIKNKKTEPNSSLGKAIAYMNNHWTGFTLFLRKAGVPLDNNSDERLMKRAVLNRKNGLFFKTEYGAWVGDVLLSFIETCKLNKINPYKYLVAVQTYTKDVHEYPDNWLPWNYTESIARLQGNLPSHVH